MQYASLINRFGSHLHLAVEGGRVVKKISLRAHNGKVSPSPSLQSLQMFAYTVRKCMSEERPSRLAQIFSVVNLLLLKERVGLRDMQFLPGIVSSLLVRLPSPRRPSFLLLADDRRDGRDFQSPLSLCMPPSLTVIL